MASGKRFPAGACLFRNKAFSLQDAGIFAGAAWDTFVEIMKYTKLVLERNAKMDT
jgi:hypothetical protein